MKALCLALALFLFSAAWAQKVESRISSMEMLVGEQVTITVTAHTSDTATVVFPTRLLMPTDIEVLEAVEADPVSEGDGMTRHECVYVLTSFRDTLYPLPPINVLVSGKEVPTNQLALKVLTVDVDTTNVENYFGPKDVQALPMSWTDDGWSLLFWLSCLFVVTVLVLLYLWSRLRSNKPVIAHIKVIKRILPHQKAMRAIDEIKAQHMVTAEDPKVYYTRLTDTLRQYINERYGFNAMEMTSSEIIDRLMNTGEPNQLSELRQLFTTADLVKFAKYSTLINENDANLVSAIEFINQTKLENQPTEEIVKPQLTTEQLQTREKRTWLKTFITIFSVAAVALLGYIGWLIYDLLLY